MLSLEDLFCCVDDFCQQFEPLWHRQLLINGLSHRHRQRSLCLSEIMTILIAFHQSSYRNFKAYYNEKVRAGYYNINTVGQRAASRIARSAFFWLMQQNGATP
jgi:hypothetical protein